MEKTSMTIRTDKEVKQQASEIFDALGMDMTTAVNVYLRQAIRYKGFHFELKVDVPYEETLEAIQDVQQMKNNPLMGKSYTDVDDMMKELLS